MNRNRQLLDGLYQGHDHAKKTLAQALTKAGITDRPGGLRARIEAWQKREGLTPSGSMTIEQLDLLITHDTNTDQEDPEHEQD
jgi:hypothetical protein